MKPMFIISCPIDTYSGYGARSRDVVKAIINFNKYDVKILPQRWGSTPWGFIEDHPEEWGFLAPYMLPEGNQLPSKPQIWAQITVPNEFQPVGEYNIGITAGIESTIAPPEWIEGMNRMNINFVSSKHSKEVFINSSFDQRDSKTNQIIKAIQIEKPIEILFEGANLTKYFPTTSTFNLEQIEEDFAYLSVGHWMEGVIGEDRKNMGRLVQCFLETFKNKKKTPALILKASGSGASYVDKERMLNKIKQVKSTILNAKTLPNIYLIHGELTDKEMNELYNHKKVKAMVSLTKGEGFGRPLLEFSLTKKPIITSNWSGHIDFLDSKFTTLIKGKLENIHKSAANKFLLEQSQWFSPNAGDVMYYLKDTFTNYKSYKEGAIRQAHLSKSNYSYNAMESKLHTYLENMIPAFSTQVQLELPNLKLT